MMIGKKSKWASTDFLRSVFDRLDLMPCDVSSQLDELEKAGTPYTGSNM